MRESARAKAKGWESVAEPVSVVVAVAVVAAAAWQARKPYWAPWALPTAWR